MGMPKYGIRGHAQVAYGIRGRAKVMYDHITKNTCNFAHADVKYTRIIHMQSYVYYTWAWRCIIHVGMPTVGMPM